MDPVDHAKKKSGWSRVPRLSKVRRFNPLLSFYVQSIYLMGAFMGASKVRNAV